MNKKSQLLTPTAVLYARVSSKEQEKEGYSIPAQLKLLQSYASQHGLTILQEFVDVETAKKAGRTGFENMLRFMKITPSCRIILVEKTDRLYRNFKDYVTIDELDLEIHLVKENEVLSRQSKSHQKFIHGIKVLMAKNYIDNLSEETRKGMNQKAEEGMFPSRCPLGYRNVTGPDERKTIEPDPDYAPLVIKLFEWYATGNYSLDRIAEMAHEAGFVYRKSKKPVSRAALHAILTNRIYTGKFDWKGKVHQGKYQPLITEDLWDKVQRLLRQRGQRKTRFVTHDFAFSGLISCGHCGCALVGEIKKGKYIYYHCTGFKGKCPERFVREEVLEECFTDILNALALDEEVVNLVAAALRQSHQDAKQFHDEAVARLQAEYTRIQGRIDAMYIDKLDGVIDTGFFDRKSAEWRQEQQNLLRQIAQHQQANQTYLEEGIQLMDLARRAPELFAKQEAKEKRRLLDFVLSNSTWANGKLTVVYRQPFDLLAVTNEALRKEKAAGVLSNGLCLEKLPGRSTQRSKKPVLTARLTSRFFRRYVDRKVVFEAGDKPAPFNGSTPSQRAWQTYQTARKRENPILVAERFAAQLALPSCSSYAQVAQHFGVTRTTVCHYMALLKRLPAKFIEWLRQSDNPIVLAHFAEHRLRPVTRIDNRREQQVVLDRMVQEALAAAKNACHC